MPECRPALRIFDAKIEIKSFYANVPGKRKHAFHAGREMLK